MGICTDVLKWLYLNFMFERIIKDQGLVLAPFVPLIRHAQFWTVAAYTRNIYFYMCMHIYCVQDNTAASTHYIYVRRLSIRTSQADVYDDSLIEGSAMWEDVRIRLQPQKSNLLPHEVVAVDRKRFQHIMEARQALHSVLAYTCIK